MTGVLTRPAAREIAFALVAEALNEGDYTIVRECVADDVVDLSEQRVFRDGRAGLIAAIDDVRTIWPDVFGRVTALDVLSDEDGRTTVALAVTTTGTRAHRNLHPHPSAGQQQRWRHHHVLVLEDGLVRRHHGWC
ncbi:nuclear transport factor 2 family protein [Labedaea rhizosphaerae]|uniref:SnoaL-like protein n=1 Tax=Labedaea rhizosphaerae TaxID=598644 RepID=A0A4R6SCT5_LABRH|nr:nuclear transport factor 2 family protein [Labedaea rhizosphaerae]TDP97751.1 SnoaL-like protein [Labedaea rhizosphaerae]